MQSGLSRELFEMWCTDPKNGVIIAGYCVEGTLAKQVLSEPEEVTLMSGNKVPLKMSVDYISFSAHTDYEQTSEFIRALKPPHIVSGIHKERFYISKDFSFYETSFLQSIRCWYMVKQKKWAD